jgi:hypothetical protein
VKAVRAERPTVPLAPDAPDAPVSTEALDALTARELLTAVDDELAKLSDAERSVLMLCGVENLSLEEAAKRLGWGTGATKGRLQRARAKLRARLEARGLTLPAVGLGLLSASPPVSAVQTALAVLRGGTISPTVSALIQEGFGMRRIIATTALVLVLSGAVALAGGWGARPEPVAPGTTDPEPAKNKAGRKEHEPKEPEPMGKDEPVKPLVSLLGQHSKIVKRGYHRIESDKGWEALWLRHQTGKPQLQNNPPDGFQEGIVDFKRCMVLAVFQGEGENCAGYKVHSIQEDKERVLVRVQGEYFQSLGDAAKTEAWGVFVLPRSGKPVVVELDTKSLIGGPPKWTKVAEFEPGDVTIEN